MTKYRDDIKDMLGQSPNEKTKSLIKAVCDDDIQGAKALIAEGADVKFKDEYGNPLIAYGKSDELRNILLQNGATISQTIGSNKDSLMPE